MMSRTPECEGSTSPDTVLSVLASEKRRAVLYALEAADEEPIGIDELADRVAATLRAEDTPITDDDYHRRIRTELYHNHLPKLATNGMIAYEDETVQQASGELTRELLAVVESHDE